MNDTDQGRARRDKLAFFPVEFIDHSLQLGRDDAVVQLDLRQPEGSASRFRIRIRPIQLLRRTDAVFPQILARFDLPYSSECLKWQACAEVELDNLAGAHRHLYGEVLASTGLRPDSFEMPPLDSFPEEDGVRDHVARCLEIYERLCESPERIQPLPEPALTSLD